MRKKIMTMINVSFVAIGFFVGVLVSYIWYR